MQSVNHSFVDDDGGSVPGLPVAAESASVDVQQVVLLLDSLLFVIEQGLQELAALDFYLLGLQELVLVDGGA